MDINVLKARVDNKLEADKLRAEQEEEAVRLKSEQIVAEKTERFQQTMDTIKALQPRVAELLEIMQYIDNKDPEGKKEYRKILDPTNRGIEIEELNPNQDLGLQASSYNTLSSKKNTIFVSGENIHFDCKYTAKADFNGEIAPEFVDRFDDLTAKQDCANVFISRFQSLERDFQRWFFTTYELEDAEKLLNDVFYQAINDINSSNRFYGIMENGYNEVHFMDEDGNAVFYLKAFDRTGGDQPADNHETRKRDGVFLEIDSYTVFGNDFDSVFHAENLTYEEKLNIFTEKLIEAVDKVAFTEVGKEKMLHEVYEEAAKIADNNRPYALEKKPYIHALNDTDWAIGFSIDIDREKVQVSNDYNRTEFNHQDSKLFGEHDAAFYTYSGDDVADKQKIHSLAEKLIEVVDERINKLPLKETHDKADKKDKKKNKPVERD